MLQFFLMSACFKVHASQPYVTTGQTSVVAILILFFKLTLLLFQMLAGLLIVSLPRPNLALISLLQSAVSVMIVPRYLMCSTYSIVFPSHLILASLRSCPMVMTSVFFAFICHSNSLEVSFTILSSSYNSSADFAMSAMLSAYLRLLILLPFMLVPNV